MERHELEAWLGPALEDLTPEQVDRLHQEAMAIYDYYPDADDREAALSASVQYLLGDLTLEEAGRRHREAWAAEEEAGRRHREARAAERHARVQVVHVSAMAEMDGMHPIDIARATGGPVR